MSLLGHILKEDINKMSSDHKDSWIDVLEKTAKRVINEYDTDNSCTLNVYP